MGCSVRLQLVLLSAVLYAMHLRGFTLTFLKISATRWPSHNAHIRGGRFASGLQSGMGAYQAGARIVSGRGRIAARYKILIESPDGPKAFECAPDVYILDQAEKEGLELPYSCRAGSCSSCAGKIIQGEIDQSEQAYLSDQQVAAGYCLTCVAYPRSDLVIKSHTEDALSQSPIPVSNGAEGSMVAHTSPKALNAHSGSALATGVSFRQNFDHHPESLLNQQVQSELYASHVYLSMGAYFDRADVALPGFKEWSIKQSEEEREHAIKFIEYINLRGGRYVATPIPVPTVVKYDSALDAMSHALKLEVDVNDKLLKLHEAASAADDAQLCDFLESNYLEEQVEAIKSLATVVRKLIRTGPSLGEFMVDKEMANEAA